MNMEKPTIKIAAKGAADEILTHYWQDGAYPVDPFAIAKDLGINVEKIDLPGNTAGGIWSKKNYPPVIFININDHLPRQRFTCAHELGHYFLRMGDDQFEFTDFRDNLSTDGTDPIEIFCNNFAANLLMPEDEIRRMNSIKKTKLPLAKYFGVSPEAIQYRLENLGIA